MATQAYHDPRGRAPKPKHKPLGAHPLFPAIVALWFGALFGLGSLAIRPALIEALVLKLHIDVILPFAAPPLGIKARVLMALGMAIGGGMLGIALGRSIARPRPEKAPASTRRQGMMAGLASFAGRSEPQQARRRPLTINESYEPQYHAEHAPLPGGQPQVLDVTEFDFIQSGPDDHAMIADAPVPMRDVSPASMPAPAETLDLSGFLTGEPAPVPVAATRPFDAVPLSPPVPEAPTPVAQPAAIAPTSVQSAVTPPSEDAMNHADLIEQLARSMRQRRERLTRARASDNTSDVCIPTEAPASRALPDANLVQPVPEPVIPAPMAMPAALRPLAFDQAETGPDDTGDDLALVPGRMIAMPAATAPADVPREDAVEPDVLAEGYSSLLGLSRHAPARDSMIRIEDEETPDLTSGEIEPAVVFPGQAPAPRAFDTPPSVSSTAAMDGIGTPTTVTPLHRFESPQTAAVLTPVAAVPSPATLEQREETERALRTALATLQRMSGAA